MQSTRFELVINLKTAESLGLARSVDAAVHRRRGNRIAPLVIAVRESPAGPTRPSRGVWPWSAERSKPDIDEPWSTFGTQRFQPLDTISQIRSFLKLKLTSCARAGNRAGFFRARGFHRHGRTASEGRAAARVQRFERDQAAARALLATICCTRCFVSPSSSAIARYER
jgi:hypothetical protein